MKKKYALFILALTLFIIWSAFSFLEAWRIVGSLVYYQLGKFPVNVGTATVLWFVGNVLLYVLFRKLVPKPNNNYV